MKTIITRLFFLFFLLFSFNVQAQDEYDSPMAVVIDKETGNFYVSSVNGISISSKQGGYISRLSSEGFVLEKKFIVGAPDKGFMLTAPKGLAIYKDQLYIADLAKVKIFNKFSGEYVGEVDFSYLNPQNIFDIAIDEERGILYATDTYLNAIYRYDLVDKYPTMVSKTSDLENPSGLAVHPKSGNLFVTSSGSGDIIRFSVKTGAKKTIIRNYFESLSGIDFDKENNLVLSSMKTGDIYVLFRDKTYKTLHRNLKGPAFFKFEQKSGKIIVPNYDANSIDTLDYQPYGSKERKN